MGEAKNTENSSSKHTKEATCKRYFLPGTLLAVTVGVVAVVLGITRELVTNAPTPRKGGPVTKRRYVVKLDRLSTLRERWANFDEGVHAAAERLAVTFVQSEPDEALTQFLEESAAATASRWGQIVAYATEQLFWALQRHLGWSRTEASGFLRMATLHVASEQQLRVLVKDVVYPPGPSQPRTLLDIGSGTGTVTATLEAALDIVDPGNVVCLENAGSLQTLLRARGYRTVDSPVELTDGPLSAMKFTTAALLNVLDRCHDPGSLLDAAVSALEPGGLLLLATVLPFRAIVYEGEKGSEWGKPRWVRPHSPLVLSRKPTRKQRSSSSFEMNASFFLEAILRRHPQLELIRWTRLPYVSSGDVAYTHYTIDMALMVLRLPR